MKDNFFVRLIPFNKRNSYKPTVQVPTYETVLRPMLSIASECYVYGLKKESVIYQNCSEILIRDKCKYKIDLSKEVITGYEALWNSCCWERGSIVIVLDAQLFDPVSIFSECYSGGVFDNPNTGNSISAVRYCQRKALQGHIACCLSASNGFEWMQIYAQWDVLRKLAHIVKEYCRQDMHI